ncbi:hypothetical protein PUN28_007309 [Cardiocondyla obscurior]|uniref:Uncharacterized protein n=1 Tax=Cardiocondyla obscurior TaxID=286306 RepID=A0AAW2G4J3_9HYME
MISASTPKKASVRPRYSVSISEINTSSSWNQTEKNALSQTKKFPPRTNNNSRRDQSVKMYFKEKNSAKVKMAKQC